MGYPSLNSDLLHNEVWLTQRSRMHVIGLKGTTNANTRFKTGLCQASTQVKSFLPPLNRSWNSAPLLLVAAWVCPGRSALQSAEQWCQRRYGRKHRMLIYIIIVKQKRAKKAK